MIRLAFALFLSAIFVLGGASLASASESYRRLVNFEWEPIDGAKTYEIEIRKRQSNNKGKVNSFKIDKAEWTGRLSVGRYEFRLRALDHRKVPGDWSGYSELDVLLEKVKTQSPSAEALVKAPNADKSDVVFQWNATPAAEAYQLEIFNEKDESILKESLSKTKFETSLASAQKYSWKVTALSKEGLESEETSVQKFTLVGPQLAKAKIEKPDNEFVREVKWAPVENAQSYDVVVAKFSPEKKKWQKFREFENYSDTTLNFDSEWSGGQYKVIVKAKALVRDAAQPVAITFPVREGDRGPATEYVQTMRKSIDRIDGWFAHASWYASSVKLNTSYRSSLGVSTSAVAGTGRLGMGLLRSESPWGLMAIFDVGGFIFDNSTYNYFGLELSAIRRQNTSDRGELRYTGGLYSKEFPAIWFTSADTSSNLISQTPEKTPRKYGKGGVLGPHAGVEYWYSMTPKFGLQANAHLYMPMTATELPNGGKLSGGDMNFSLGLLGSYRYSRQLTGLMGVNFRSESYTYTDSSDSAGWNSGVLANRSSTKVKTTIDGIYFNFMAEYSF